MRSNPNPFLAEAAFYVHGPRYIGNRLLTVNDELYTREEAMDDLSITSSQLDSLIRGNRLPHVLFGGAVYFPVVDFDAMPRDARQALRGITTGQLGPAARIAEMYRKGIPPAEIAAKLRIAIPVVFAHLSAVDPLVRFPRQRRGPGRPSRTQAVQELFPSDDNFTTAYYMHLNGYSNQHIRITTGLSLDTVSIIVDKCEQEFSRVQYPMQLDRSVDKILKSLFVDMVDVNDMLSLCGVSRKELAKFVLTNKDKWPSYIAQNRGRGRLVCNPFLIKDGFRIVASETGKQRITGKDELITDQDVAEFFSVPVSNVRRLVDRQKIPHIIFGGVPFFPFDEIDAVGFGNLQERLVDAGSFESNPGVATWVVVFGGVLLFLAIRNRRFR